MDSSLPGSAIHGIFQARILEWAAISFSRGSSQPRDQTRVSCIADRRFTVWATWSLKSKKKLQAKKKKKKTGMQKRFCAQEPHRVLISFTGIVLTALYVQKLNLIEMLTLELRIALISTSLVSV